MRKKISDTVYVLFQPCLVYFAFGNGMGRIPPQARFVLMALVGLMMIVNLYFCEEDCFQKMQKEEAKEEVSGTFQLTETCRSEMLSTPRQIPCWISVLSKASAPWKYIPDVHDTITAIIRASTERQNSAAGTIQVLTYLLHDGKKFLTILAQMTFAGRLEYHICDADFAGGFGCRHFLCVFCYLFFGIL